MAIANELQAGRATHTWVDWAAYRDCPLAQVNEGNIHTLTRELLDYLDV